MDLKMSCVALAIVSLNSGSEFASWDQSKIDAKKGAITLAGCGREAAAWEDQGSQQEAEDSESTDPLTKEMG